MVGAFTITEVNCLVVNLFVISCCFFLIYICVIKLFGCAIFHVLGIDTKGAIASPKSFAIFQ